MQARGSGRTAASACARRGQDHRREVTPIRRRQSDAVPAGLRYVVWDRISAPPPPAMGRRPVGASTAHSSAHYAPRTTAGPPQPARASHALASDRSPFRRRSCRCWDEDGKGPTGADGAVSCAPEKTAIPPVRRVGAAPDYNAAHAKPASGRLPIQAVLHRPSPLSGKRQAAESGVNRSGFAGERTRRSPDLARLHNRDAPSHERTSMD